MLSEFAWYVIISSLFPDFFGTSLTIAIDTEIDFFFAFAKSILNLTAIAHVYDKFLFRNVL